MQRFTSYWTTSAGKMKRDELEDQQWAKLSAGLDAIFESNRFYSHKFSQVGLRREHLKSIADVPLLPFTTKAELLADQTANPPYGSNLTFPLNRYVRLHQTSGTTTGQRLRWLDTPESWSWILDCWDLIYTATGVGPQDRLFFPFSFGPFLGFWAGFDGASRRGHFVLPGGGMSTSARLDAIAANSITIVLCTPTYALRMAEVAAAEGFPLARSTVRALILAGEPGASIPAVRERIEESWGARVFDHSGMTEIGSLGIEFEEHPGKLFLLESETIAEFLDPESGQPVEQGQVGELVLTNLGRWGSPLIRYRTGDLVRWGDGLAPKGFSFRHLDGGIVGRADDMLWIKGNNVYPSAVEGVLREFAQITEFEIYAIGSNASARLMLKIELHPDSFDDPPLRTRIDKAFQDRLSFRPQIEWVPPDTLPRYEMKARRFHRLPAG